MRPAAAGRGVGRVGRHLVGHVVDVTAHRGDRDRALEPTPPGPSAEVAVRHPAARRPATGPVVAVTDYMRAVPDQVSRWVPRPFVSLGTDGFGRSDARPALRRHFEIDAAHVVVAVLDALARHGEGDPTEVAEAITRFDIDPESASPLSL